MAAMFIRKEGIFEAALLSDKYGHSLAKKGANVNCLTNVVGAKR
jgi:hypothetical protein